MSFYHFTRLVVEAPQDKPDAWILFEPLIVLKDDEVLMEVPVGFVTDLASLPRGIRSIYSRTGRSRYASVIHDYLYSIKWSTRKECDKMFKELLIASGVSRFRAQTFYMGVRAGGWTRGRW